MIATDTNFISDRLSAAGFEVYLVGGAVRDILLGKQPKDFDFVTNATPEQIADIFKDCKICYEGKAFKVTMINGIEVATYRKDRHNVLFDAKQCDCSYAETLEEDLARRDLTINAMAFNPSTTDYTQGTVIDPFNGYSDLSEGLIRFVGDPEQRIKEDPARIIRACRFLASIEGTFEENTLRALQKFAYLIETYVAKERIAKEIMSVMSTNTPSLFFSALATINALQYVFPSMVTCINHEHGQYHKENIFEHIMMAGDNISIKFPLLRLAAFLHDIGKPPAFAYNQGENFVGHEYVGSKIVAQELKELKFSNQDVKYISNLVKMHMRQCRSLSPRGIRRLHYKLNELEVSPRDFIRLKLADRLANMYKGRTRITPVKELVLNSGIRCLFEELPLTVKDLALSGGELIQLFELKPGPIVGELQRNMLNHILDVGEEFNNKEYLKQYIKDILCGF